MVHPVLEYGGSVLDLQGGVLRDELESMHKISARFVTGNYNYVWLAFLDIWNANPSIKGGTTIDSFYLTKI